MNATVVKGFSGPLVCDLTGVTYRQLDYWTRTGLLVPSIEAAVGSGNRRVYGYADLLEVKVIKSLLDAGLSLTRARQAVDCLRTTFNKDLKSTTLVIGDTGTVIADVDGLVDLLRAGQGVFNLLPLSGVVAELTTAIDNLSPSERGRATA
jgi:DNA-binding transcriptional MerR regulator